MSDDYQGFGWRLRSCRQSAGLSQEGLAERSGLSVRAISKLERGHARWPYQDTLRRLADALELQGAVRAEFIGAPGRRPGRGGPAADTEPATGGPAQDDDGTAPGQRAVPARHVPRQ